MAYKITIRLIPSSRGNSETLNLEDLNLEKEEWDNLSTEAKRELVQPYVDACNEIEPPYWEVSDISISKQ